MVILKDLWSVLKGEGIALDKEEAEWLGNTNGETISYWMAVENRHGRTAAHLFCAALWLVQANHCRDQLIGVPMQPSNYVRAIVLLILFAPIAATIGLTRGILHDRPS